jgi:hypothetical protein
MLFRLLACALLCLGAACADPDGKFDEFVRRTGTDPEPDAGVPVPDGGFVLPTAEQVSGTFLSVVSTNISPKKPVVYLLEVTAVQKGEELELTMVDQPLAAADRMTPVGMKSAARSLRVTAAGSYQEMLTQVVTPAEANPVLPAPTLADTTFHGQLAAAETDGADGPVLFWCGTVTGHLYEPLDQDITGTFTISRIVDGVYPEVVINCAKEPADPL